jgi:hypothetical protein
VNASASGRGLATGTLAIYAIARAIGFHMLFLAERRLDATRLIVKQPFLDWRNLLVRWDAHYYDSIARGGYPAVLPAGPDGAVLANNWAFFPAFPFAVRLLTGGTGLEFETAAVILNLAAGGVAAVLIARIVNAYAGEPEALAAVALWSFFPTSFLLQAPYSEALFLACSSACLHALITRRWLTSAAALVGASLCRAFVLPLSIAALWVVARSLMRRDRRPPGLWVLGAAALTAPFLWMSVAATITGRLDVFTATQTAWGYAPTLGGWISGWRSALEGLARFPFTAVVVGVLLAVAALTIAIWRADDWPIALKVYATAAAGLVWIAALPGSVGFASVPRFAFSILTLPMILSRWLRSPAALAGALVLFVALQYLWIVNIWSGRLGIAP